MNSAILSVLALDGKASEHTLEVSGLLGDLLGQALLVHAAVHDRPRDLARVLALLEQ